MAETTLTAEAITVQGPEDKIQLVEINGHLDEANVDRIAEIFYQKIDENPEGTSYLIDFQNVAFINSKGIGYFLDFFRKITEKGGKMVLARIPENVLDILEVVGVTKIIETHFTIDEAKLALAS